MSQETPLDEFDAVAPLPDGRRGAHRARRSRVASLLSAALVAGATAAVAGGAYVLLHDGAEPAVPVSSTQAAGAQDAVAAPAADAADAPAPTGTPSAAASEDAGADESPSRDASAPGSPSQNPSGRSTSPEATGQVDTTLPLVVLNGTRTTGLAGKASSQLHRLGWKVQSTGNERSGATATTVTYRDADMAATAAAVASDLGGRAVHERGATEGVLTVVLGPDYAG